MVIPGVGVLYNLWIDNQNWNWRTLQNVLLIWTCFKSSFDINSSV